MRKLIMTAVLSGLTLGSAQAADFTVSSSDIVDGKIAFAQFANAFGCTGDNLSPAISWSGAPEGTKSFVVSMYDKDAPTGSGFWHWVVIDIPATETGLAQGAGTDSGKLPAGAQQTLTDAGMPGYAGICPPLGSTHEYVITVKALGVDRLPVDPRATGAMVGLMSNMNILAVATLTATGSN
jgi:Raf kinase inhibitor-like YbhB/YbcL family protein